MDAAARGDRSLSPSPTPHARPLRPLRRYRNPRQGASRHQLPGKMRGAGRAIRGSVRRIRAVRSPPDARAETRRFESCGKSVAQAKHCLQGTPCRTSGRKGRPHCAHGMRGQPIPMSVQRPGRLAFPDVMFTSGPTRTAQRVLLSMSGANHPALSERRLRRRSRSPAQPKQFP